MKLDGESRENIAISLESLAKAVRDPITEIKSLDVNHSYDYTHYWDGPQHISRHCGTTADVRIIIYKPAGETGE